MRCLNAVLFVVLFGALSWAQTGTSTIRGTVTDPQGSLVPNATIKRFPGAGHLLFEERPDAAAALVEFFRA